MLTAVQPERVTLYYRQGASDKVYHAAIESKASGFIVTFAYGRRGSTLTTGTKTHTPMEYATARKIYDKLVKEKTAKSYTPGESGTPYQQTENAERATGIHPQLLNPVDEAEADLLLSDDGWWMQEKFDGQRTLIRKEGERVIGINRKGLVVSLPDPIVRAMRMLHTGTCLLDGEAVGDQFIAFDLLQEARLDLRPHPYQQRLSYMIDLVDSIASDAIRYAQTAVSTTEKQAMFGKLWDAEKEGVVFKRHDAPYTAGRPSSGGTQRKLKFYATASCLVADSVRSKRSVGLELIDITNGDSRVGVGNVTIPANHAIPAKGDAVEVRYLYAYPGGSLYQPVYLGRREDLTAESCTLAQLKFKAASEEDSA